MAISLLNVCGLDLSSIDTSHCHYADTNSKYVLQATALGIVNGVGGTGTTSLFAPKDVYKRQMSGRLKPYLYFVHLFSTILDPLQQTGEPVSYTHLDVYKRQHQLRT